MMTNHDEPAVVHLSEQDEKIRAEALAFARNHKKAIAIGLAEPTSIKLPTTYPRNMILGP